MDIEQTKLIDKYERLFAEEGWLEFVEDMKSRQTQIKELILNDNTATERTLYHAQGQNFVYSYIISLEELVNNIKKQQAEELPDAVE